ncbi:coiled-coil domain-containing protein 172 [Sphaeramia orbicularis]|uniref:coiled-coil domain-containing protein 172 n=1 Tax=Sphaeramia orbicularis TaxID=375764 RepID=UPI00117E535C|nr:coiled-coil domain-containing protein 172 [Sphaeramia orbicularis]
MSLDTLFQQILLTEHQLTEQKQKLKEVNIAIIQCKEKINVTTEKYDETTKELDEKAQQSSAMKLQRDLMKKSEDQMSKKMEELLCQKGHLRERLDKIKKESAEEEENFLREISGFNSDFSLCGNREAVVKNQTHTEILDLEREVESLHKEMEQMRTKNRHITSLHEEKKALQLELQELKNMVKDLDSQLSEAEAVTTSLREESLFVSQKPLTDSAYHRLRKELETYKESELERRWEALSSELHTLQSKLAGIQRSEQR